MLAELRPGESRGLDHLSLIAVAPKPSQVLSIHDPDGTLIELAAQPSWGRTAQSVRLALPPDLGNQPPAFDPVALTRINLRSHNVERFAEFYCHLLGGDPGRRVFPCGRAVFELSPAAKARTPGLGRLTIAVRNFSPKQARRILRDRGIRPYGSRREVLFRDPDGNELELVAP